jgi:ATP-dependent HslUV protease ATP-binding subunit HslU
MTRSSSKASLPSEPRALRGPSDSGAFSPREIVSELDRYIIGQTDAKRAVAVALRNRWRRQQLPEELREEVLPKNILMIGPTGVGKTEIARRLARLAQAPFLKVEATKFTEVGYVGRDVEQIVRDLVEISLNMTRERLRKEVKAKAELAAEERLIDALVGEGARDDTRIAFRRRLRNGELDDKEVELELADTSGFSLPTMDIPGMPGASMGMINLNDMLGKAFGGRTKKRRMPVSEALAALTGEESDKLLDQEAVTAEALSAVEQNGIVFLDELDKITARSERIGADVSREGVQRDLLPLIEGTTVATKHGSIKTDFILFIASGAFHLAKPSDLLPELQGRLPIRVELNALTRNDFRRILTEPENSLIRQYRALMGTEDVTLEFTDEAIDALADLAAEINSSVENIGARRLHTVLEKLLDEISFTATDRGGETITIDAEMKSRSTVSGDRPLIRSARRLASSVASGERPAVSTVTRGCDRSARRCSASASSQMIPRYWQTRCTKRRLGRPRRPCSSAER